MNCNVEGTGREGCLPVFLGVDRGFKRPVCTKILQRFREICRPHQHALRSQSPLRRGRDDASQIRDVTPEARGRSVHGFHRALKWIVAFETEGGPVSKTSPGYSKDHHGLRHGVTLTKDRTTIFRSGILLAQNLPNDSFS